MEDEKLEIKLEEKKPVEKATRKRTSTKKSEVKKPSDGKVALKKNGVTIRVTENKVKGLEKKGWVR